MTFKAFLSRAPAKASGACEKGKTAETIYSKVRVEIEQEAHGQLISAVALFPGRFVGIAEGETQPFSQNRAFIGSRLP